MCVNRDLNVDTPRIHSRCRWLVYKLWICHFVLYFIAWEICGHDMLNDIPNLFSSHSICNMKLPRQGMENSKVLLCVSKIHPCLKHHLSQMMISFLHPLHLVRTNSFRLVTLSSFPPQVHFWPFFRPYATIYICSLQNWRTLLKWICLMFRRIL